MNSYKNKNRVVTAIIISVFGSMALSLYCTIQQQAFAATVGEIEEKYLKDARNALENGNTTGHRSMYRNGSLVRFIQK